MSVLSISKNHLYKAFPIKLREYGNNRFRKIKIKKHHSDSQDGSGFKHLKRNHK